LFLLSRNNRETGDAHMRRWSLFIDGRQVETEGFQDVINPSTGGVAGVMPLATAADLDAAVAAASSAFLKW
jgi:acyl-CoA reductase-like NAD-dependent aldehyde dehydrogenase